MTGFDLHQWASNEQTVQFALMSPTPSSRDITLLLLPAVQADASTDCCGYCRQFHCVAGEDRRREDDDALMTSTTRVTRPPMMPSGVHAAQRGMGWAIPSRPAPPMTSLRSSCCSSLGTVVQQRRVRCCWDSKDIYEIKR